MFQSPEALAGFLLTLDCGLDFSLFCLKGEAETFRKICILFD